MEFKSKGGEAAFSQTPLKSGLRFLPAAGKKQLWPSSSLFCLTICPIRVASSRRFSLSAAAAESENLRLLATLMGQMVNQNKELLGAQVGLGFAGGSAGYNNSSRTLHAARWICSGTQLVPTCRVCVELFPGCVCLGLCWVLPWECWFAAAVAHFVPPDSLMTLGWRIPFLASSVTLIAAIIVRFDMPESTEFAISHDEIEQEFHSRLQQRLQHRKQQQQQQQQPSPGNNRPSRYSCSLAPIPSCSDLSCSARQDSSIVGVTNSKSNKGNEVLDDMEAVRQLLLTERHYVPAVELLRRHWGALLLQCGYEAWIGAALQLGINWLPGYFMRQVGLPQHLALWMVLSSVALFAAAVLAAGAASDWGVGRLRATMVVCGIAGATSIPMFMALSTKSLAACWLVQAATLTLAGCAAGMLPAICCSLYPAGVRVTGVCLGFHLGMLAFGVLTPVALSAIKNAGGPPLLAPGAWMTAMAVLSIVCSAAMTRLLPHANAA